MPEKAAYIEVLNRAKTLVGFPSEPGTISILHHPQRTDVLRQPNSRQGGRYESR